MAAHQLAIAKAAFTVGLTSSLELSNLNVPLQPFLVEIFQSASSGQQARVRRRLDDLLLIWKDESFYERDFLERLGDTVTGANNATSEAPNGTNSAGGVRDGAVGKGAKDAPFVMPATHGDPSTLCYDLPAGNLMPHIIPNSLVPIRPDAVRPLQFSAGPADESLVNAVKDFLYDVEKIDNPSMSREEDEGLIVDIDSLGQRVVHLETGEIDLNASDTYYGWSRAFCDKIKNRRNRDDEDVYLGEVGRSPIAAQDQDIDHAILMAIWVVIVLITPLHDPDQGHIHLQIRYPSTEKATLSL
ncbi:MAG: hypothetical protein Q9160_001925 [Pyrenula sp. 1 TL-2023]